MPEEEKTEEASQRRIDQARERGDVPKSRELNSAIALLLGLLTLRFFAQFSPILHLLDHFWVPFGAFGPLLGTPGHSGSTLGAPLGPSGLPFGYSGAPFLPKLTPGTSQITRWTTFSRFLDDFWTSFRRF